MLGSYYKVIEGFQPQEEHQPREQYLSVEEGDILIDYHGVDENWCRATDMVKQKTGLIPRSCVQAFVAALEQQQQTPDSSEQSSSADSSGSADSACVINSNKVARNGRNQIAGELTENPLAAVLDSCEKQRNKPVRGLPLFAGRDKASDQSCSTSDVDTDLPSSRTPSKEENYVDMSSGENIIARVDGSDSSAELGCNAASDKSDKRANCDKQANSGTANRTGAVPPIPKNPHPKPRRGQQFSSFRSRASDDGYSSSIYSGEPAEQQAPLLTKERAASSLSKQDEAGYEVPMLKLVDSHGQTIDRVEARPKSKIKALFKSSKYSVSEDKLSQTGSKSSSDNGEEGGYYAPNTKLRDSYFLPSTDTTSTIIRMFICLVIALLASLAVFLVLTLVADVYPVLSFSLAAIVFVVLWVAPVTLLNRGFACVVALLAPSLSSTKVKVGIIVLLTVILITGPLFSIIDKLSLAISCSHALDDRRSDSGASHPVYRVQLSSETLNGNAAGSPQHLQASRTTVTPAMRASSTQERTASQVCFTSFDRVLYFCSTVHQRFMNICRAQHWNKGYGDQLLCSRPMEHFCGSKERVIEMCNAGVLSSASTTQNIATDGTAPPSNEAWRIHASRASSAKLLNDNSTTSCTGILHKVLTSLLPLLLLLLIHEAYSYNKDFQTTKDTDNVYITSQLKEIDSQRKQRGLSDLIFPLTRLEFRTNLVRRTFRFSKYEWARLFRWLLVWFIFGVTCLFVILLETYIHNALQTTRSSGCAIEYRRYDSTRSKQAIYAILACLFVLIVIQNYILRLRSKICSMFYPKREAVRAMHLYYRILHDRAVFSRRCRRRVQLLAEEKRMSQEVSFKTRVYRSLPVCLQTACDKLCVYRCMVCRCISFRKTVVCEEAICRAHYCFACYVDAEQVCIGCRHTTVATSAVTTGTV